MSWNLRDVPDLAGRVAVVTGANGGLGFETARVLAGHGAHVVMAARNPERAAAARARILAEVPRASLQLAGLDTGSLESVRSVATALATEHHRIDILVNNAGVMAVPRGLSHDGHELQLAVNHLGHFALTALLAPNLLRSPAGRVVSITSTGRFIGGPVDPGDPDMTRGYGSWAAYGRSKLAAAQLTVELQRRLEIAGVGGRTRAIAADPGFSRTGLQVRSARESQGLSHRFFEMVVRRIGSTPAHGALPQIRAATDPDAVGGALYGLRLVIRGGCVRVPYLVRGLEPASTRALWELSEHVTGVRFDLPAALAAARGD
jgi:NAD(P)-dependent dehydrogenase (short-subunit alcohol dehydrogenase family)